MDALPKGLDPHEWAVGTDGLLARKLGPWARDKLFYVARYIDIFNSGMQRKWPTRVYIDMFSGPGIVLIGGREELTGSPLLALQSPVPFTHLFLNDVEPLAIQALQARCGAGSYGERVHFSTLDCNDAASEIRRNLPGRSLDLAFIDPTNWQIAFRTIAQLTAGRRMDLIITFHVGGMKRAAEYAPANLDAFFGTPEWRRAYEASLRAGKREGSRILLDCYEQQLRSIGYLWVVDDVRITNRRHVGLYHLVFASKSERGEDFWQKITDRSAGGQLRLIREAPAPYQV